MKIVIILVIAVIIYILGAVWYGVIFKNTKEQSIKKIKIPFPMQLAIVFASDVGWVYLMKYVTQWISTSVLDVCFVISVIYVVSALGNYILSERHFKDFIVNEGYKFISINIIGVMLYILL